MLPSTLLVMSVQPLSQTILRIGLKFLTTRDVLCLHAHAVKLAEQNNWPLVSLYCTHGCVCALAPLLVCSLWGTAFEAMCEATFCWSSVTGIHHGPLV